MTRHKTIIFSTDEFVYFPKNSIKSKENRTPFSNYAPPRYSPSSNVAVLDKFRTFLVSAGRLFAGQVHPCGWSGHLGHKLVGFSHCSLDRSRGNFSDHHIMRYIITFIALNIRVIEYSVAVAVQVKCRTTWVTGWGGLRIESPQIHIPNGVDVLKLCFKKL